MIMMSFKWQCGSFLSSYSYVYYDVACEGKKWNHLWPIWKTSWEGEKKTNGIRKGMFTNKLLSMQSPFSLANFGAFTVSKAGCDN